MEYQSNMADWWGGDRCKLQVWLRSILKSNKQCEICPALFQLAALKLRWIRKIHLLLNFCCQTPCCRGLSEKWRSLTFEFVNCNQAMGYSGGGQKCRSADLPEGLPASPPFRWPLPCSPALTILSTTLMVYDSSCSVKVVHVSYICVVPSQYLYCMPSSACWFLIYLLLIAPSQRPLTSIVTLYVLYSAQ